MKLPFADASFDGVYAIESTCHAPDRAGVYGEIMRVLKVSTAAVVQTDRSAPPPAPPVASRRDARPNERLHS